MQEDTGGCDGDKRTVQEEREQYSKRKRGEGFIEIVNGLVGLGRIEGVGEGMSQRRVEK